MPLEKRSSPLDESGVSITSTPKKQPRTTTQAPKVQTKKAAEIPEESALPALQTKKRKSPLGDPTEAYLASGERKPTKIVTRKPGEGKRSESIYEEGDLGLPTRRANPLSLDLPGEKVVERIVEVQVEAPKVEYPAALGLGRGKLTITFLNKALLKAVQKATNQKTADILESALLRYLYEVDTPSYELLVQESNKKRKA